MPVQSCSMNGKPGYQYGDSGRCYTYTKGSEASRKRAKRKAHLQGAAVEANSGKKHSKELEKIEEFDDSLNDYIDLIRREFELQFPYTTNPDGTTEYYWVNDVFEDYVVVRSGRKYYEVGFKETEDDITFDPKDKWTSVKLSYVQEMLEGSFRDVLLVSEFKGKYPEIQIFKDVDMKELTADDPSPVFATLPIGMANITSGNRRHYDSKFVKEMEKQVREKKPIGLMGHLSDAERSHAFPAEAVHWVGVAQVNELLWGKGYFPPGGPRDRLRRYKATNKRIATSIDAEADGIWKEQLGAYHMIAETLNLHQIDIAPEDRAGIPDLSAVPLITQEFLENATRKFYVNGNGTGNVALTEDSMGKEEVIKELTVGDISALPQSVKDAMIAEAHKSIREQLGLPEGADVSASVKEINRQKEEQRKMQVSGKIKELASHPEKGIKVESVREVVMELVESKNPKTEDEAQTYYDQVVQSDRVKKLLETVVQETMGPPQKVPVGSKKEPRKMTHFYVPGKEEESK